LGHAAFDPASFASVRTALMATAGVAWRVYSLRGR